MDDVEYGIVYNEEQVIKPVQDTLVLITHLSTEGSDEPA